MSILDPLMRYGNAVAMEQGALQSSRATPDEALMLNRLADKALATAAEFGVACDRRQALARARQNLAWAHQAVLAKGIAESEWML